MLWAGFAALFAFVAAGALALLLADEDTAAAAAFCVAGGSALPAACGFAGALDFDAGPAPELSGAE